MSALNKRNEKLDKVIVFLLPFTYSLKKNFVLRE